MSFVVFVLIMFSEINPRLQVIIANLNFLSQFLVQWNCLIFILAASSAQFVLEGPGIKFKAMISLHGKKKKIVPSDRMASVEVVLMGFITRKSLFATSFQAFVL